MEVSCSQGPTTSPAAQSFVPQSYPYFPYTFPQGPHYQQYPQFNPMVGMGPQAPCGSQSAVPVAQPQQGPVPQPVITRQSQGYLPKMEVQFFDRPTPPSGWSNQQMPQQIPAPVQQMAPAPPRARFRKGPQRLSQPRLRNSPRLSSPPPSSREGLVFPRTRLDGKGNVNGTSFKTETVDVSNPRTSPAIAGAWEIPPRTVGSVEAATTPQSATSTSGRGCALSSSIRIVARHA